MTRIRPPASPDLAARRLRVTTPAALLALAAMPWRANARQIATERSARARFRVIEVASGLANPWSLAFLPDGRRLVTERPGRLRLVDPDGRLSEPLAGVPAVFARGQGGLFDVVPSPQFASDATLYLCYAEAADGGARTAVARGRLGERGLTDVGVVFRQQPAISGSTRHFGGRLVFGRDGLLYVTLGDRGSESDRAQDLTSHIGTVVRIRPDGSVPPDNPFVGRPGALPEIWSYGHRNIQGATLHPQTGALWVHEHGARGGDEINRPEPGKNYGWPVITHGIDYSGAPIGIGSAAPGMEQPVLHWTPSIAPSGMAFYTGDRFPDWQGNLFVGALKDRMLVRLELDGERIAHQENLLTSLRRRIRDVRAGPDGLIYLLTDESAGQILRLEPAG